VGTAENLRRNDNTRTTGDATFITRNLPGKPSRIFDVEALVFRSTQPAETPLNMMTTIQSKRRAKTVIVPKKTKTARMQLHGNPQ